MAEDRVLFTTPGIQGLKGPQGTQGPIGPQGPTGPQGPPNQAYPGLRWVSEAGSDSNDGYGPEPSRAFATIQKAIDVMPNTFPNIGGKIIVLPGTYAPFTCNMSNVIIEGYGGPGISVADGPGLVQIAVGSGQIGASLNVGGSHKHAGPTLKNLAFKSTHASAICGIKLGSFSNFNIDRCSVSGFTGAAQIGIWSSGDTASQYGVINACTIDDNYTGISIDETNGLRLTSNFIQGTSTGITLISGTCGIRVNGTDSTGSDTFRSIGNVVQFCDVGIELNSYAAALLGDRFEACNTGVLVKGNNCTIGPGLNFNNYILLLGDVGKAIQIDSSAEGTIVFPLMHSAVLPYAQYIVDNGLHTKRLDGYTHSQTFPFSISATGDYMVLPAGPMQIGSAGGGYNQVRYAKFHVGMTAIAASGSNYWQVALKRGLAAGGSNTIKTIDSQAGWAANQIIDLTATFGSGSDYALVDGDNLFVTITKVGTPSALSNPTVQATLVEY